MVKAPLFARLRAACFSCRRGTGPTFSRKSRQKAGDGVASGNPLDCPVWKRGAQFGLAWVLGSGFLLCRLARERAPDPFPNRAGDFPALLMSPVVPAAWVVFSFGSKEQRSLDDEGTLLFWLINRSHKRAGRPSGAAHGECIGTLAHRRCGGLIPQGQPPSANSAKQSGVQGFNPCRPAV